MKTLKIMKTLILAFSLIIITGICYGQTLSERIENVGKIYVIRISDSRLFLQLQSFQTYPQWGSAAGMKSKEGDELMINTMGKTQGNLLHFKNVDQSFLNLTNESIIGIFKDQLPSTVEFIDDMEEKGDSYFLLEITANNMDVQNDWLIEGSISLSCTNMYYVSLYEFQPDYKKPKRVTGSSSNVGGEGLTLEEDWSNKDKRLEAAATIEKSLYEKQSERLSKWSTKASKKIGKALAKE